MPAALSVEQVTARLAAAGCVAAAGEAGELMAVGADAGALDAMVARRELGEPLAWIVGRTRFCGHAVRVDPGVYVPRPHTEELALRAVAAVPARGRALDLCTGCGAVAVVLAAVATVAVMGLDADPAAVECARRNGVAAILADVGEPPAGPFDVVTAVPPYVPTAELPLLAADVLRYEPRVALEGGGDGLAVTRRVVAAAAGVLRPGGTLLLELGGDQDGALLPVLVSAGFDRIAVWRDEDGDLRGVSARMAG